MSPVHLKPQNPSLSAKTRLLNYVGLYAPKGMTVGLIIPAVAIIFLGYLVYFAAN